MNHPSSAAAERSGAAPDEAPLSGGIRSRLVGVAGFVAKLQRGERAVLRRLARGGARVPPEVFWRIVERYSIPPHEEDFWLAVLPLMVKHAHEPRAWPGKALLDGGVSPARLERWLRLDHAAALREAGRVLSQLDRPVDWAVLGDLLYRWDEDRKKRLARDFFMAKYRAESNTETPTGEE